MHFPSFNHYLSPSYTRDSHFPLFSHGTCFVLFFFSIIESNLITYKTTTQFFFFFFTKLLALVSSKLIVSLLMSCPKTHSKGMMVISHLKPKGSKWKRPKHLYCNWKITNYQIPVQSSITKILKSPYNNF